MNVLGDMDGGCPDGSCCEWLLVGISSLVKPPAPSSSLGSSSAGGALGVTPAGPWETAEGIPQGGGLATMGVEGVRFTAIFPM